MTAPDTIRPAAMGRNPFRSAAAFPSGTEPSKPFVRGRSQGSAQDGFGFQPPQRHWPSQQPAASQHWNQPQKCQPPANHPGGYPLNARGGLSPVMYDLWNQRPQLRSKVEAAGTVIDLLGRYGINARLGGSLAASAYGALRDPKDLDIYVLSTDGVDQAYGMLSRLDAIATTPDGQQVRVQGAPGNFYYPGRLGQLNMALTYQNGQSHVMSADIVNQNAPGLAAGMLSPAQRGVPDIPGNMSAPDLVVGFLHRHVMRPQLSASKNDVHQIAAVMRHAGIDPANPVTYYELVDAIGLQFSPETREFAKSKMREILYWMTTGQI